MPSTATRPQSHQLLTNKHLPASNIEKFVKEPVLAKYSVEVLISNIVTGDFITTTRQPCTTQHPFTCVTKSSCSFFLKFSPKMLNFCRQTHKHTHLCQISFKKSHMLALNNPLVRTIRLKQKVKFT